MADHWCKFCGEVKPASAFYESDRDRCKQCRCDIVCLGRSARKAGYEKQWHALWRDGKAEDRWAVLDAWKEFRRAYAHTGRRAFSWSDFF